MVKDFAIQLGLTNQNYTMTTYRNMLKINFSGERRASLLQDFGEWKRSLDAKIFFFGNIKQKNRTITETRGRYSAFVDEIIREVPQGSPINNDNSNNNSGNNDRNGSRNINCGHSINNNRGTNIIMVYTVIILMITAIMIVESANKITATIIIIVVVQKAVNLAHQHQPTKLD